MDFIVLAIHAVSGTIGGNASGNFDKDFSLGTGINSLLGIVGGVLGGHILHQLGVGAGPLDAITLLTNIASGALSGALLTFLVGAVRLIVSK